MSGKLGRNLVILTFTQVSGWVMSIILLIVVPRYLGPSDLGKVAFATAFVSYFGTIGLLGSNTYLMKSVARDPAMVGPYVFNGLVMKASIAVALSVVALIAVRAFDPSFEMSAIVAIACLGMLWGLCGDILSAGLYGTERFAGVAVWGLLAKYLAGGASVLLLVTHQPLLIFLLVPTIIGVIPIVANTRELWTDIKKHFRVDLRLWKTIAIGGLPFLMWNAILVIYGTIDIPLLRAFTDNEQVGWYGLAYQWIALPAFISSIIFSVFFPSLSNHGVDNGPEFRRLANGSMRLTVFLGIPVTIGMMLVIGDVIGLLYSADFAPAVPVARILSLHIPLVGMSMVLSMVLIAADRQKQWLLVGAAAALLNPLLNLFAIPMTAHAFGNGALGAAGITVFTEMLMTAGAVWLRPKGVLDSSTTKFILRTTAAALVMVPIVLALNGAPLAVKVIAGVLTYAVASIAFGTITVDQLKRALPHVMGSIRVGGGGGAPSVEPATAEKV